MFRLLIITQDEPFYLYSNLEYLLENIPSGSKVIGCVVSEPSPFGKKENFFQKTAKTYKIFGGVFFLYYSGKFIYNRLCKPRIKQLLKKNNIPVIELAGSINSKFNLEIIKKHKPDLLISILGNQIFKKPLIDLAPSGCINLHTALLPKYRGLMPSFWVLKNKETHTGVTVFFVDEGIDSGPIIIQEKIEIGSMTQEDLISKSKKLGMDCILKAIQSIIKGDVVLKPNQDELASYYSFPTKQDVEDFVKSGKRFF